jgi:hypothetical protein
MTTPDYATDFHAWAQAQAEALRVKDWPLLDVENLVEEVEGLAERHRSAMEHQLERLLIHLLKYQYQPEERPRRGRSWRVSIASARHEFSKVIRRNPSLQAYPADCLAHAYRCAAASRPPYGPAPAGISAGPGVVLDRAPQRRRLA